MNHTALTIITVALRLFNCTILFSPSQGLCNHHVCPSVCLASCTAQTTGPIDAKFGLHVHIHHSLDKFEDGFDRTCGG